MPPVRSSFLCTNSDDGRRPRPEGERGRSSSFLSVMRTILGVLDSGELPVHLSGRAQEPLGPRTCDRYFMNGMVFEAVWINGDESRLTRLIDSWRASRFATCRRIKSCASQARQVSAPMAPYVQHNAVGRGSPRDRYASKKSPVPLPESPKQFSKPWEDIQPNPPG